MSNVEEKLPGNSGALKPESGNPCMIRAANKTNQVIKTKGNVKELTLYGTNRWFRPTMTQVVMDEKMIKANHIKGTFPRNVGRAHPTSIPLNPHRPIDPFSAGYFNRCV